MEEEIMLLNLTTQLVKLFRRLRNIAISTAVTNCAQIVDSTLQLNDPSFVATCSKFAGTIRLLACSPWKLSSGKLSLFHTLSKSHNCHQLVLKGQKLLICQSQSSSMCQFDAMIFLTTFLQETCICFMNCTHQWDNLWKTCTHGGGFHKGRRCQATRRTESSSSMTSPKPVLHLGSFPTTTKWGESCLESNCAILEERIPRTTQTTIWCSWDSTKLQAAETMQIHNVNITTSSWIPVTWDTH